MIRRAHLLAAALLAVAGCDDVLDLLAIDRGFEFHARAAVVGGEPDTLAGEISVVNRTGDTVVLRSGGCGPFADVYVYDAGTDALRWAANGIEFLDGACIAVIIEEPVAPGDSLAFHARIPVPAILGDSLLPGPYRIALGARHRDPDIDSGPVHAATLELSP